MEKLTRTELAGDDGILNLVGKLLHALDFFLRLFPLFDQRVKLFVHSVSPGQVVVHLVFLDGEPLLDRLFSRPVFPMRLSLDENGLARHIPVPSHTDSFGSFSLFQTTEVELEVFVVKVN